MQVVEKSCNFRPICRISLLAHKRSKIWRYVKPRLTSIESSFHPCNTLTAIVPGAYSLWAGAPEQPKNRSLTTQKVERYNMSYLKESCLRVILRYVVVFIARQHTAADARYWYSNSVCPSVRLSVRDTLVLYENGLTYRHNFSTIR